MMFSLLILLASSVCLVYSKPRTIGCNLEPESGNCRASFEKFYYDPESKTCKTFIFGGCGGNSNNFFTHEECMKQCAPIENMIQEESREHRTLLSKDEETTQDVCQQEQNFGECFGYFPRFSYNRKTEKCEEFVYGGCGGNDNNFRSLEDCVLKCQPKKDELVNAKDLRCLETAKQDGMNGMACMAYMPRWSYDHRTATCVRFIYGGCGGNNNSFISKDECVKTCKAQPSDEVDDGQ